MIANFVIHAAPTGKARPRVTSHGTYTPKKTKDYERFVAKEYLMQCAGSYFGYLPVSVTITAYYPIPKSASKKNRQLMLERKIRPTKKPDWDNIGKIVADSLNGVAYRDDSQVVDALVRKYYSETPRVEVIITDEDD